MNSGRTNSDGASVPTSICLSLAKMLPLSYGRGITMGLQEKCGNYLSDRFAAHPSEATTFLGSLTGKAWGMESGLLSKGGFQPRKL